MSASLPAYRWTVYAPRATDVTESTALVPAAGSVHTDAFKVASITGVAGFQPYLDEEPRGRRGAIDPLEKQTTIGEMTLTLLDKKVAPPNNLARWVTAFLGDVKGNPQWMGLKVFGEESFDDGTTWHAFFSGRVQAADLNGKARFDLTVRDFSEDLKLKIFTNRPHPLATGASLFSFFPAGLMAPYGAIPAVAPFTGTTSGLASVTYEGRSYNYQEFVLDAKSYGRRENILSSNWVAAQNQGQGLAPGFPYGSYAQVKRLDTGTTGLYRARPNFITENTDNGRITSLHVGHVTLFELRRAAGVATGTPLVNGAKVIGQTSISIDGWTISTAGILKAGDLLEFAGHRQVYVVQADANSDGAGNAVVTISPALVANIADNEGVTPEGEPGYAALPPNATSCQLLGVFGDMPASDSFPILIDGVHRVQLWQDILNGYYSPPWRATETVPTGQAPRDPKRVIRYDAAKFAALIADTTFAPLRIPVTDIAEAGDFIRDVICQDGQLTYYIDGAGLVVPVDLRMPTSLAGLPTIGNADLVTAKDSVRWGQTRESAISSITVTYYEDATTGTQQLPASGVGPDGGLVTFSGALLASVEHQLVVLDVGGSQLSDADIAIDARGMRFMAGDATIGGVARDKWVRDKLLTMVQPLRLPYSHGAMEANLACRRGLNGDVFPGQLALVTVDELPDPATRLRGGTRLLRAKARTENGPRIDGGWLDMGLAVVAGVPTIAAPTQQTGNTRNGADVLATLDGAGDPVEVQYAVTGTGVGAHPVDGDPLWITAKVLTTTGHVTVTGLPVGQRVWFRDRSLPGPGHLQLPSAWVYSTFVDLATYTAPSAPTVTAISGRQALFSWTNGTATLASRIYITSPTTDPLVLIAVVPPGQTSYLLRGLDLSTNYKVGVSHDDGFGGETTVVTTTFVTTGSAAVGPNIQAISVLKGLF